MHTNTPSKRFVQLATWSAVMTLAACSGADATLGLQEPIRLTGGQYVDEGPPEASAAGPSITAIDALSGRVRYGMRGKFVAGRTTTEATSVAAWLDGTGSGYWIRPVGAPSPADGNERTFSLDLDFSTELPPGRYDLRLAALNSAGLAGESRRLGSV